MADHDGIYFKGKSGCIEKKNILIVEGQDDAFVFDTILKELGANPENTGIIYMNGNDLDGELSLLQKSRAISYGIVKKICIVMDSDENHNETTKKIKKALKKFNCTNISPNKFYSTECGKYEIGYTLIPSHNENGNIELACLKTVEESENFQHVNNFYTDYVSKFGELDIKYKRLARIYISVIPGRPQGVGVLFKNGTFNCEHTSLNNIKDFMKKFIS